MAVVTSAQFDEFFTELHGYPPFPWQIALAAEVCKTDWPPVIDLPTGSGKTACIDIALFALACRERAPRRIFFVVDRKVIVDEAFIRMCRIALKLAKARKGILADVAARLRDLAGDRKTRPLHTFQLRGGIYRDESWVRSPLQATVVASTVDQIGSRLLFRGYGVGDSALPIHAGLIANDALILLDEAHCSRAFAETLDRIQKYRRQHAGVTPFNFVQMTATPANQGSTEPFQITDADRQPEFLGPRLTAPKPTSLVTSKIKPGEYGKLADLLVNEAHKLIAADPDIRRVAIMVNRVATAQAVFKRLKEKQPVLVIGAMRPVDREGVLERLKRLKSGQPRGDDADPIFVVATQCLEVGADLDFDALVTECASMEALLQRFGRLDRLGAFRRARAVIVVPAPDLKKPDAVYGEALVNTHNWLQTQGELDFGLETPQSIPQRWKQLKEDRMPMTQPASRAAVLLPAHLDTLVQTSPRPSPEPAVQFFLHGQEPADADVHLLWRADLNGVPFAQWGEIVALCPPVSAETLPVKLWRFQAWLLGENKIPSPPDIEGAATEDLPQSRKKRLEKQPLILRGGKAVPPGEFRPGDTIVLPATAKPDEELGHVPEGSPGDVADSAYFQARRRVRLRLHRELLNQWPPAPALQALREIAEQSDLDWTALQLALQEYNKEVGPLDRYPWLRATIAAILRWKENHFTIQRYPAPVSGWIVEGRRRLKAGESIQDDDGNDEPSAGNPVSLDEHTEHVRAAVRATVSQLDPARAKTFDLAAEWHDAGKADGRFQALLHGGDAFAARFAPRLLAKGHFYRKSRSRESGKRSGLPHGFRHELLSLLFAASVDCPASQRDLMLHLIASHHGHCRPFAPVIIDTDPQEAAYQGGAVPADVRLKDSPHHLTSGVPDRFWRLTRTHGWWGLAYLEALFRVSDWKASADEQKKAGAK